MTTEQSTAHGIKGLKVLIRGAGEMASGVAVRLYRANFRVIMTEIPVPLCIRRTVSFSEAVYSGQSAVEDCRAVLAKNPDEVFQAWNQKNMAVILDPDLTLLPIIKPDVIVDAILAKKNLNLRRNMADLVIALGPGFTAGQDAHVVVETNRGHDLGRLMYSGQAEPNTGVPGNIAGQTGLRVLRAPADGPFESQYAIGTPVEEGQAVAWVNGQPVKAKLSGMLRGLIRPGTMVTNGLKVGDVDPRGRREYCYTVSDKARAIGGSVLEAVLGRFNR